MRRATITISDDLEPSLEAYLRDQEVPPSLTRLLQAALRDFLASRGYVRHEGGSSAAPPQRTRRRAKDRQPAETAEANVTDPTLL